MKSATRGAATSQAEVSGISAHGLWVFLGDREVFLPFKDFPWFRDASVAGVLNLERPQPHHLYWPDLDVDLHLDSIDHPETFPLICRERPNNRLHQPAGAKRLPRKISTRRARRR